MRIVVVCHRREPQNFSAQLVAFPEEPSVGRLVAERQPDAVTVRHAAFLTKYVVHRGGIGCARPVPEWIRKLGGEDGKVAVASVFLGADGAG